MEMETHVISDRHYASKEYLLPADSDETKRPNTLHRAVTKAFENRLTLAPLSFKSGDRVLESATAGTGIWALEFFAKNFDNNIILNLECIDITDKQFPQKDTVSLPSNIHFLVNSVLDLPSHWSNTFIYAHQRLLYVAMNESRWQLAIEQLFRCLEPGGWLELVEADAKGYEFGGGPHSKRLSSLIGRLYAENGVIVDLSVYLLDLLEKTGFSEIHCERRILPVRRDSSGDGIDSQEFYDLWMGMKGPIMAGHGYGIIETSEEFDTMMEWQNSQDASVTLYNITARKPEDV